MELKDSIKTTIYKRLGVKNPFNGIESLDVG